MTIKNKKVILDTNIWVFGLRRHPERPACTILLELLSLLNVVIPRQILRELQANLTENEFKEFFRLLSKLRSGVTISWEKANIENVRKYQNLGCKLGDAVVASHLEELGIEILISENRHFLEEIKDLPFRRISAAEALVGLEENI